MNSAKCNACNAGVSEQEYCAIPANAEIMGCKSVPETHDCMTKEVWTAAKTNWCCANKRLGCPAKLTTVGPPVITTCAKSCTSGVVPFDPELHCKNTGCSGCKGCADLKQHNCDTTDMPVNWTDEKKKYGGYNFDTTPVSCNGGENRLCVLDRHYAGAA